MAEKRTPPPSEKKEAPRSPAKHGSTPASAAGRVARTLENHVVQPDDVDAAMRNDDFENTEVDGVQVGEYVGVDPVYRNYASIHQAPIKAEDK